MFDLSDKRAMNKGFGDGMSRAFEFVATPLVFGGLGHLLDRAFGTGPTLLVGFALFAVIGMFLRLWYGYDAEMRGHEAAGSWNGGRRDTEPVADLWSTRKRSSQA